MPADPHSEAPHPGPTEAAELAPLDRALIGALPCAVCGYDLQGLSIRGVCPECGTAVRATILFQVDPQAEEFRPLVMPRWTAWSLVVWSVGALIATLGSWIPRIADAIGLVSSYRPRPVWAAYLVLVAGSVSGMAMLGLLRTIRGAKAWHTLAALIGALAYLPLLWSWCRIQFTLDPGRNMPYFNGIVWGDRTVMRLVGAASMAIIILGIRPNARELVRRSLALRTGRVDRQTLLVLVACLGVASIGDLLRLGSIALGPGFGADLLSILGTLLILLNSAFFTLGVGGAVIDSWRIGRAILAPSPSLRQVIGDADRGVPC